MALAYQHATDGNCACATNPTVILGYSITKEFAVTAIRAGFRELMHTFRYEIHPRLVDLLLPQVTEEVTDTMRSFQLQNETKVQLIINAGVVSIPFEVSPRDGADALAPNLSAAHHAVVPFSGSDILFQRSKRNLRPRARAGFPYGALAPRTCHVRTANDARRPQRRIAG